MTIEKRNNHEVSISENDYLLMNLNDQLTFGHFGSFEPSSLEGDRWLAVPMPINRIHAIRCHRKISSIFLTGEWDQTIDDWDQRIPYSQEHFSGPHLCAPHPLALNEDEQQILTGSWRKDFT